MRTTRLNILTGLVALLVLCPALSLAAEGIWTKKPDIPMAGAGRAAAWCPFSALIPLELAGAKNRFFSKRFAVNKAIHRVRPKILTSFERAAR